jgi:hypothetical protein
MVFLSSRSRSQLLALPSVLASCWSWSRLLILATPLRLNLAFDTSPTSFGPKRYHPTTSSLRQQDLAVIAEDDPFSLIRGTDPDAFASTTASTYRPDDLTNQELALRFKDVLAYFASVSPDDPSIAHFTETYTPQLSLLRGRLDDLHLSRCTVLPSTIPGSGNGLFATRDIDSGELGKNFRLRRSRHHPYLFASRNIHH